MPSAKRKATATPSAAPPAGKKQKLNIDKDPPLSLRRDPATKQITLSGRPAWPEVAKKIKINRAAPGHIEDRRHLVHWDEHLKPILGSVFTAMEQTYKTNLYNELQSPLRARSLDNMAQNADDTMLFVAKMINGAPGNLVPDRGTSTRLSRRCAVIFASTRTRCMVIRDFGMMPPSTHRCLAMTVA
jgi:hypothetical protein